MENIQQQKFSATTACAGCPAGLITRTVLGATNYPVIATSATGCLEVTSTIYPNTAWKTPFIHSVFGNVGAVASGIETAKKVLAKKQGFKSEEVKVVAFAGDGGTYDIGLQALSGALERGHDFLFVCYDNGAYMNTGGQRSGSTPFAMNTETTPSGKKSLGKTITRKDIMKIVEGHKIPYLATANVGFLNDFEMKVKKAFEIKGPKFLLVFSPCVAIWGYPTSETINLAKLGTETNFWPLYEIENGKYKVSYEPKEKVGIEKFLQNQARFKHIFKKENKKEIIEKIQTEIDENWTEIKKKAENN